MGNSESRHLVESPQALADEVKEAAQVLESAVEGDDEHSSGDDEQSSSSSHTNPGDEAQTKILLGGRLYPLIQQRLSDPDLAGIITLMLLESDNSDVLRMMECPWFLGATIEAALQVLEAHGMLPEMGNSEARHLTFTSDDASNASVAYLMMTDDERANAPVPMQELCEKMKETNATDNFVTFKYEERPDIFHESQLDLLGSFLDFMWDKTAPLCEASRVDMRLTLTNDQLVAILGPLDSSLDHSYKSSCLVEEFGDLFRDVPNARSCGHKIAFRMTRGPTNSCIDFHCDGHYASSTSQIPLNPPSEYKGGKLCFFVNGHLHEIPRIPGSLVQHPPRILHGVTSVTEGTRKSLFIVDMHNGLGETGVITLTSEDVISFNERKTSECATKCPICLESIKSRRSGVVFPCGHMYHCDCWDQVVACHATDGDDAIGGPLCALCKGVVEEIVPMEGQGNKRKRPYCYL